VRGRRATHRQRHAEDGIGAQPSEPGRAVERDQPRVDLALRQRIVAPERLGDLAADMGHRSAHAAPFQALPPSRSSCASWEPVDAPEGTDERPKLPSARRTSTSTVGRPRESRIWRATMASMCESFM